MNVTFTPPETTQQFTIEIEDDNIVEDTEEFTLEMSVTDTCSQIQNVAQLYVPTVPVTICDNDSKLIYRMLFRELILIRLCDEIRLYCVYLWSILTLYTLLL